MSTSVSWNGSSYTVPATGEEDWGGSSKVDGLLVSLAQNALSKAGGTFALTAEVDFSSTAGLKSLYYKSRGTNVSTTGILRLANLEGVGWRNAANSADLLLTVSGSDRLQFDSVNVPTISSTDTLTNKTLTAPTITAAVIDVVDNSFSIKDNSDATKIAQFQCSGITTGTTRTYTLPDTSDTVVTLAATQTLTNKTLDGVTVTTAIASTGIAQFQDGASGFKVANASDNTKGLVLDLSGSTALKTTTIATSSSLDRTITLPNATTTLVGTDVAQTLSSKTFSDAPVLAEISTPSTPSSGYGKVYFKSDGFLYQLNDDGTETKVGAGSGGINYISNPDAESSVTGWSTYADAAGASPVDGTGGSPTVTITRTTTTPLRGTGSFLITKDAANRQGEGVSFAFSCDSADKAKCLNISFDYEIASGTFTSGDSSDIRVWIYDVTNSTLIPVTPATIQGGGSLQWKFSGVFQTASNSTSYRLILHCATTSASAYTFEFDNVVVGPQIINYGAPIGDWTSFTPTGGWASNASYSGYWRRVGDTMEVQALVSVTGATSGNLSINLPSGYSIDTAKLAGGADGNNKTFGRVSVLDSGTAAYVGHVGYSTTTSVMCYGLLVGGTYGQDNSAQISGSLPVTFANGDAVFASFSVPISGWSSTVVMSNDTDTRVVAAKVTGNPASAADGNPIIFPTSEFDTHGSFSVSTGRFTAPVSGTYSLSFWFDSSATTRDVHIYVDASQSTKVAISDSGGRASGTVLIKLNAGQLLDVRPVGGAMDVAAGYISVQRLSGPSAIAASEKIYVHYQNNGGTSLTGGATNIDWITKVVDSHGAWSGTVFTAPRPGFYCFEGMLRISSATDIQLALYKNGSSYITVADSDAAAAFHKFSTSVYLLTGDTVSFRSGTSVTLTTSANDNWISIYSQG